jgi:uncharacterized repeat protein (TIGR03843 family)
MAAPEAALDLLARGDVAIRGRMPWSSNATFLAEVTLDDTAALAVYKPLRGERPLWDFPSGLYRREVAAYLLSEALAWGLVPPTICRDGPLGEGSFQLFVPADFEQNYFTLRECPEHRDRLLRICLFDLIANNADRKGGHCLLGEDGTVYAIDNGLTFHQEWKLRTVIWDFGGDAIPDGILADVQRLLDAGLPGDLETLLSAEERKAFLARGRRIAKSGRFPDGSRGGRDYPWPLV